VVTPAFKEFLIQNRNVPAEKISVVENGVESDQFSPGPTPRTAVLTFFIARLLYLLCFERVGKWGAYSIPSETDLLIPSDYVN
jgi:hypothetical protein